jgi:pimeloyl-ACP methyl ester carboxylesterase
MNGLTQAIPGRLLIELRDQGVVVRGTLHTGSQPTTKGSIGIVFLNSLSLPRTATGDSAVFWAECFANAGYPSFRLDLPGLGDSGGTIPVELLNYINAGEYASIAAAKAKELVEHFGLAGVVLVGHCAGTVTAIYAAADCPKECKGLVLLDPYFHLPQAVRPLVRRGLSEWAMRNRLGGLLSNIYDHLKKIRQRLSGNRLPQNANKKLLLCWKKVASSGLPILYFKAPARKATAIKPRLGEFDYLSYILQVAGPSGQIKVTAVENTDHSFANKSGRTTVARDTKRWLFQHVPVNQKVDTPVRLPDATSSLHDEEQSIHLNCLHS